MSKVTTLIRAFKRVYEETVDLNERALDSLLFPTEDVDTTAGFMLEKYVLTPYGVSYRASETESHVITYDPGTGSLYEIPVTSMKTPIGEDLSETAIVGLEVTDSQAMHLIKLVQDIVKQHQQNHKMTKIKQSIDAIRDGVFYARGLSGEVIGKDISFGRAVAMSTTYNFTTPGNTMSKAVSAMWALLKGKKCSPQNLVLLMGESWADNLSDDTSIMGKTVWNDSNILVQQQMVPSELKSTKGLVATLYARVGKMTTPLTFCVYSPGVQYKANKAAAEAPWIPDNEAVMFSLDSPRFKILRGVNLLDGSGGKQRAVGELLFDAYVENDPTTDFVRSHSRHAYIPANADHTVRVVGTF